jgi:hypothetical protein
MKLYPWSDREKVIKESIESAENSKVVRIESVEDWFDNIKKYKPTLFERIWWPTERFFRELCWNVYRFFKPCHQRIRKVIPRRWCDLTELTLLINFEIIKSFVEEEMYIIDWESQPEHKKAGEWLRASYKYITEERPKLEKELSEAYDNIPRGKLPYEEKYKDILRIEKTIDESDKSIIIGIANYRGFLWS